MPPARSSPPLRRETMNLIGVALAAVGFSITFAVILLDPPCYSVVQIEPKSFQAVKSGQSSPDLQQRQSRYASYAVTRKQSENQHDLRPSFSRYSRVMLMFQFSAADSVPSCRKSSGQTDGRTDGHTHNTSGLL